MDEGEGTEKAKVSGTVFANYGWKRFVTPLLPCEMTRRKGKQAATANPLTITVTPTKKMKGKLKFKQDVQGKRRPETFSIISYQSTELATFHGVKQ